MVHMHIELVLNVTRCRPLSYWLVIHRSTRFSVQVFAQISIYSIISFFLDVAINGICEYLLVNSCFKIVRRVERPLTYNVFIFGKFTLVNSFLLKCKFIYSPQMTNQSITSIGSVTICRLFKQSDPFLGKFQKMLRHEAYKKLNKNRRKHDAWSGLPATLT